MLPNWDDSLSVHNPLIDEQHKKLFALAHNAYNLTNRHVTKEEIKDVLSGFFEYMKTHFNDEEGYMESIGYPLLDHHKVLHRNIIKDLSTAIKTIKNINDMKLKLHIVAKEWLLKHILQEDVLIEKYRVHRTTQNLVSLSADVMEENNRPVQKQADLENIQYKYKCKCPGKVHLISSQIQNDINKHGTKFICRRCKALIISMDGE
ncbi:MAG: hemerythrin family protein [Helicobacteraceae bacterium]